MTPPRNVVLILGIVAILFVGPQACTRVLDKIKEGNLPVGATAQVGTSSEFSPAACDAEDVGEVVQAFELADQGPTPCDLAGFDLMFPDGFSVIVPEVGGASEVSSTYSDVVYTVHNLGPDGTVAQLVSASGATSWGTDAGKASLRID